jgi:SAM-dependent methyltransferase
VRTARHVRLRELLVGIEGLALLRNLYDSSEETAEQRLLELRSLLDDESLASGEPIREAAPRAGYRAWSSSYDEPGNPIVALEQPVVWSLLDSLAPGRALDAACGTGRHARRLVELGHQVLGVDLTPEMLEQAAADLPRASFLAADLRAIPAADQHFDVVVCGLALSHLADLRAGVAELARVLRPGGRLVVSILHPFQIQLGWHARFTAADGQRAFIREHPHTHSDYLAAFAGAGLELRECLEPIISAQHLRAMRRAFSRIPEATVQAYAGLPGVLVWHTEKR